MLEQRIHQHFIDSADLNYQLAQGLSKPMAEALQALLVCVTSGGKVLAGDQGSGLSSLFARHFIGGFERERPELPAVALDNTPELLARQVRALGQPGDVAVLLADARAALTDAAPLQAAVMAAHEREMTVILLAGRHPELDWGNELQDTDIHIPIPHNRPARVQELQLQILHGLCDGIDVQLLGEDT
ncbi:D-sedoheptulose 7-phosphate isomerase [Comamonas sp. BIGb0124]|uniref:phosphoheptose isomerase n=1 Tax=Comamonas sp. BIGb0124 TaxID=2485130 RepID=UPI000F46FCE5|nr:phosphoheptose isomerase [Comamonas sp. BIGb0124]ROR26225.1 D-sedoheptulose 7-phosphate isomerase [Comamonas sp. BIGb0124]